MTGFRLDLRRSLLYGASAIALLRFVLILDAGVSYWDGDFFASMPGPHVRHLNPTLWVSPDLSGTSGRDRYIYGPTQHLTLLPLILLDSYRRIAGVLLGAYAVLMVWGLFLMWGTFAASPANRLRQGVGGQEAGLHGRKHAAWELLALLSIAMFFFPPAMQAVLQREFEVVIFFVFNFAAYSLVKGREGRAGAAFGYITWFKT